VRPVWGLSNLQEIEVYSIMSVYLRPKDGKGVPSYLPGQYIGLRANVPGEGIVVRNYSLSSAPASDVFRITVKRDRPKGKVRPHTAAPSPYIIGIIGPINF
jgi:ferredoxin-NADP reductase